MQNVKFFAKIILLACFASAAFAASGKDLAAKLGLSAGDKAMKQWERMFSSPDKMASIGADKLSGGDKEALKSYLMNNAADSDHPAAAGK